MFKLPVINKACLSLSIHEMYRESIMLIFKYSIFFEKMFFEEECVAKS